MKIIDLSHSIKNNMPCFGAKWHITTLLEQMGTIKEVGRNTTKLVLGSHAGTHIDSPAHFIQDGRTIDQIPLEELVGKVTIVDFSHLKENHPIEPQMLSGIDITSKMIFYFDWAKKFKNADFYKNYPYFTQKTADFLIKNGVKLIGMDTPSPDDSRTKLGSEEDSIIHKKFLQNNVILIEYLNNLDQITDFEGWTLVAMPLKLENCDGSPARIFIYKE